MKLQQLHSTLYVQCVFFILGHRKKPSIDVQTNGGAGKWNIYVESLDKTLFLGVIFTLFGQSAHEPNRGKCISEHHYHWRENRQNFLCNRVEWL